ncbi:MAG: hypothetical protein GY888_01205, partial [Planctomycetaceae bacterium]|nr:hypothetical protein [Planctomycetaceae bacterium]
MAKKIIVILVMLLSLSGCQDVEAPSLVTLAEQVRSGKRDRIVIAELTVEDEDLAVLSDLSGLVGLTIQESRISDEGLRYLKGLKDLEELHLRGAEVGDQGIEHLLGLEKLRNLNLPA